VYLNSINIRQRISITILTLTTFILLSCADPSETENNKLIRGRVISVVAKSISDVQTFKVQSPTGEIYSFQVNGFIGFTPSHIKEHQVTGDPVTVTYISGNNVLIATKITD